MNEKILFKTSLLCGILGIFIILLTLERVDLGDSNISSINLTLIDKQVKIKGYITSLKETPGLYLINLRDDTGEISIVIFKEEPIAFEKNQMIEVQGTVVKYKDKPEIQAKIIKVF